MLFLISKYNVAAIFNLVYNWIVYYYNFDDLIGAINMIFDKMDNISDYFEELPLLKKVEEFVADFNHKKLSDGTMK